VLADGSRSRLLLLGSLEEPSDRMRVQYATIARLWPASAFAVIFRGAEVFAVREQRRSRLLGKPVSLCHNARQHHVACAGRLFL